MRVEVDPINQPPVVDAGPDQNVVLPDSARLQGSAADDDLPNNTLVTTRTKLMGPDGMTIVSPSTVIREVTFTEAGVYEFQLEASDSEFTVTDTVMVTVSVGDLTVVEGSGGLTEAMVPVTLSSASNQAVAVDFLTFDGTALTSCDYVRQFGTLSFAVGETSKEIRLPIVGDLAVEPNEDLMVRLGNVVGAEMGDGEGMVTIEDDDGSNEGPAPAANRTPANGATGLDLNPTLSWTANDPDGDPLDFDVYFGTAFGTDGQAWVEQCSATPGPEPRAFGATALDEANDRLMLFGGASAGGSADDVWVLENASGARGIPSWQQSTPAPGPLGRQQATAAYDAANNRFIISGDCSGDCDVVLADTWVLTNANGLGGVSVWEALPDAPIARRGTLGAYDADSNRLIVFGGTDGSAERNDLWVLKDANGIGTPAWEALTPTGDKPSPRFGMAGGYDPQLNRLVVFGGREAGDVVANDVWVLAEADGAAGAPEWTELTPGEELPGARWAHTTAAYEPTTDRLLVFGGSSSGFDSDTNFVANDVWLLTDVSRAMPTWMQLAPDNGPVPSRHTELEAFDELTVTVVQPNTAPMVEAGDHQATSLPAATITLNGVVTDDDLPSNTLTSTWSLVSGPGSVIFVDENAPVTDASFDTAGAYTLRLTATDGELSSNDDVDVIVASAGLPPDLIVELVDTSALVVNPQSLEISGTVAAVIGNTGVGPAAGPFEVTFFEDLNRNATFEMFEDNIVGVGSHFGIDARASAVVVAPANPAALEFQGHLIYAFVDSSLVVDETDETNNIGSSAATCETSPFSTDWNVQTEWAWRGSSALPDFSKIIQTPVVIDLDGDRFRKSSSPLRKPRSSRAES